MSDEFKRKNLPTRFGGSTGRANENRMITSVQGQGGIRRKERRLPNGGKVVLRTRSDNPTFLYIPPVDEPPVIPEEVGEVICIPNDFETAISGYGAPFTFDPAGHSMTATENGQHPNVLLRRMQSASPLAQRWPELEDEFDLDSDPLYGARWHSDKERLVSWDYTNKVYHRGKAVWTYSADVIVLAAAISKRRLLVAIRGVVGDAHVIVFRHSVTLDEDGNIDTIGWPTTMWASSAATTPVAPLTENVAFSGKGRRMSILYATSVSVVDFNFATTPATGTGVSLSLSGMSFDTYTPTASVWDGPLGSLECSAEKSAVQTVVWRKETLCVVRRHATFSEQWTQTNVSGSPNTRHFVGSISMAQKLYAAALSPPGGETLICQGHHSESMDVFDDGSSTFTAHADMRAAVVVGMHPMADKYLVRATDVAGQSDPYTVAGRGDIVSKAEYVRGGSAVTLAETTYPAPSVFMYAASAYIMDFTSVSSNRNNTVLVSYSDGYPVQFGTVGEGIQILPAISYAFGKKNAVAIVEYAGDLVWPLKLLGIAKFYDGASVHDIAAIVGEPAVDSAIGAYVGGVLSTPHSRWKVGVI